MALIENVEISFHPGADPFLFAHWLEAPNAECLPDAYALDIAGWAIGTGSPPAAIEVTCDGRELLTIPVEDPRPDVVAHYPDRPVERECGFRATVGLLGVPLEPAIILEMKLRDGTCFRYATIRLRRRGLSSAFSPTLQPLMITCLGRSGSTLLMRMLIEHPDIVGYRQHPYETRMAAYFARMLEALTQPPDHAMTLQPGFHAIEGDPGPNPYYSDRVVDNPRVLAWFGRTYAEDLAAFFQGSVESFYKHVAAGQGQPDATYFVEKMAPSYLLGFLWELYPRMKEIFLVRDFRDVVSSILAFNQRRGYDAFGREQADSDEGFVSVFATHALVTLLAWQSRSSSALLVRYEDLILKPAPTLSGILDYLNLPSTPALVDRLVCNAFEETPDLEEHRTARDAASSIGRWRYDLPPSLRAESSQALAGVLSGFGYDVLRSSRRTRVSRAAVRTRLSRGRRRRARIRSRD